jgi:hypothetical protein
VVVAAFLEDARPPAAKYATQAWLLDKSGRVVQNMKSEHKYERPPAFLGVAHDRLVISVNSRVEVHR